MLGRRNIRDSIGYVTLGLFSHALLDELFEAKSKPDSPPHRRKMIDIAIESLQAIVSPEKVDPLHWKNLVFQNYQEARTLYSAFGVQTGINDPDELKGILDEIVQSDTAESIRLTDIDKAMKFFRELARMAVVNAESPEEQVPPGVRQLVAS